MENTTIQVKIPTKKKLNNFKNYLLVDFDKIIDGFIDLVYKYKLKKDLKEIVDSKNKDLKKKD